MAFLGVSGCKDSSSPDDITIQDLAGTWVATSFVYTGVADPAQQVDLVADGGSFTMVITAAGEFTGTTIIAAGGTYVFTGTLTISGTTLTQDFDEEDIPTLTWTISAYTDDSMTLSGARGPFDFTDNGTDDLVTASIRTTVSRQ